ncbi:MAG: hypothetical protein HRT35_06735 [Algicola sp.]|nr:hypothetical protein [Algicola sp.]
MTILSLKKVLSAAILVGLASPVVAETTEEWGHRVLNLQANLDFEAPLAKTTWVGSHNSFANAGDDSMVDYNQAYSLKHQLRKGVRELVFDVHWELNKMMLCHNNVNSFVECGDGITGNRKLTRALDDIKEWLNEDQNLDQIVLLKLEMTDSARRHINKVEKKILGSMGSYVYRPDIESSHGDLDSSTGCTALPSSTLTKKQVLDAGKNVIIFNTHDCISDGGFNNLAFYADNKQEGGASLGNVKSTTKLKDWTAAKSGTTMSRAKDAMTREQILSDADSVKMKPSNIEEWMLAGLNIFELYGFDANGSRWIKDSERPVQAEDMVWSWSTGQPDNWNDADCAAINSAGKMDDASCSYHLHFACKTDPTLDSNGWVVTSVTGSWQSGYQACESIDATFSAPTSLIELHALKDTIAETNGAGAVTWINYTDQKLEGQWLANKSSKWLYGRDWSTVAIKGGSGGTAFDDFGLLHLDLYRNKRHVTKINMSAGNRVDKVGFEYDDGNSVSHGGNGYDRFLEMLPNEYIYTVEVCVDSYNGSDRIHYLGFTTIYGNKLSGGIKTDDCRFTGAWGGFEVFAMHGRAGNELDALGFYLRRRD